MGVMERVVLELPAELAARLRATAASEGFASESELVETLLRLYEYREADEDLDAVREAVAEGLADVEAGRIVDAAELHDELEARYRAKSAGRKASSIRYGLAES